MKSQPQEPRPGSGFEFQRICPHNGANIYMHPLFPSIIILSGVHTTSRGAERLVSISVRGHKPSPQECALVVRDFCLETFERDDHGLMIAEYWQPVNNDMKGDCECK